MTSTGILHNQVTSTSTSTMSTVTTKKCPQHFPFLPAEIQVMILAHLPLTTLLYLATRSPYFRRLITTRLLTEVPPDSNSLTIMASNNSQFWPECKGVTFREGMGPFKPPDIPAVLRFLASTKRCITLHAFRMRLCLIERGSQTDVAASEVICYKCIVAKPLVEFGKEQTEGERVMGGSGAIKRRCLACEWENGWTNCGDEWRWSPEPALAQGDPTENGQKVDEAEEKARRPLLTIQWY